MPNEAGIHIVAESFADTEHYAASNRDMVIAAYENLLGYNVDFMAEGEARLGYWQDRLAGDLARDDFVATFLDQAANDRGSDVSAADFAGNQRAVEAVTMVAEAATGNVGQSGAQLSLSTLATTASAARAGDMPDEGDPLPTTLGADIVDVRAGELGPFADLDDDGGNGLLTGDLFPEPPAPPLLSTAEADAGA